MAFLDVLSGAREGTSPLNMVLHGNSLFNGIATLVAALRPADTIIERSVGGVQTSDLLAEFDSQVHIHWSATKRNVVLLWEIVDHVNDFDGTGSTAYAAYASYVAYARSKGWYVYVCTCIDTTEFDPPDIRATYRDQVNAALRVDYAGAHGIVDFEYDPMFRASLDAASNTTNYQGDGIHLTSVGQSRIARILASTSFAA